VRVTGGLWLGDARTQKTPPSVMPGGAVMEWRGGGLSELNNFVSITDPRGGSSHCGNVGFGQGIIFKCPVILAAGPK
jgi:hypothetical protein